jgi:hypothetical protein
MINCKRKTIPKNCVNSIFFDKKSIYFNKPVQFCGGCRNFNGFPKEEEKLKSTNTELKMEEKMEVKTFNEDKISKLIKESDPYLKQYIKSLKEVSKNWENIANKAIAKLRKTQQTKN